MHRFTYRLILGLMVTQPLFAAVVLHGENDYWKCVVSDAEHKQYAAQSAYKRTALNKAYDDCKKTSQHPASCKAAIENCEAFIDGLTTRPMWQCVALDFYANPFVSNIYRHKYDAAFAAQAYCRDNSEYPDSCYINLITCGNLNKRI